jgi:hypothetical protein
MFNESKTETKSKVKIITVGSFKEARISGERKLKNGDINWEQFRDHMLAFEEQLKMHRVCF